jgi:enoyl-CoA hydratase/carnithine racemase
MSADLEREEAPIRVERSEGIVLVTLNRPAKKNAMTRSMWRLLRNIIEEIGGLAADRVLILTGAGTDFCAGGDLSEWSSDTESSPEEQIEALRAIQSTALALHDCPKPSIAAINGVAAGGGFTLALGCDLTVAAEEARLGAVFIQRGLVPDLGGHWVLPRLIGLHRAKEVALFGELYTASQASALGLINRVVPREEVLSTARELARRLVGLSAASLAAIKLGLNSSFESTMAETLETEALAQYRAATSLDFAETSRRFLRQK